ncbi:MAG: hypothetical protein IKD89_04100 [Clostridia bacterium]|nr:hypothetical protein [Clostridia bacterium]
MKKDARQRIKQRVTAFILTFLVFAVGLMTVISALADKGEAEEGASSTEQTKKTTGNIFEDALFPFDGFINLYSAFEVFSGAHMFEDAAYGYIIKDKQGKLHFSMERSYEDEYADAVCAFSKFVRARGVPFMYVQAPNKKIRGYTVFPPGAHNDSNEDADVMLAALNEAGIETMDLRERLSQSGIPYEQMFYYTDHHWTNKTAFWAFCELEGEIYARFGIDCDPEGYHTDIDNYDITYYEKYFLGSQGRRVGAYIAGVDDYTFISPKEDMDFEVYDMVRHPDRALFSGGFSHAVKRDAILIDPDISTNRYGAYFGYDYGLMRIINKEAKNDIKLLMVKDSFALPIAAYLSTCVSELWLLDPRDEGAPDPYDVVQTYDFDAVVMMYNTEAFNEKSFGSLLNHAGGERP